MTQLSTSSAFPDDLPEVVGIDSVIAALALRVTAAERAFTDSEYADTAALQELLAALEAQRSLGESDLR